MLKKRDWSELADHSHLPLSAGATNISCYDTAKAFLGEKGALDYTIQGGQGGFRRSGFTREFLDILDEPRFLGSG